MRETGRHVRRPKSTPVATYPGRDAIAERIRSDIMSGRLKFGQKLSENGYASLFNVSRTPVREAIVSLQSLGLLVVRPRSGTYVTSFTHASLTHLFEVRQVMEVAGVKLSSRAERDALAARLECIQLQLELKVESPQEFDAFSLADTEFHTCLVDAAGNALLSRMYRPIAASAQAARSRLDKTAFVSETANIHHRTLLDAVKAHDIDRFDACLREHLAWVLGMLMQVHELFGGDP